MSKAGNDDEQGPATAIVDGYFQRLRNAWVRLCTGRSIAEPFDEEYHRQLILVMTSAFWLLTVLALTFITPFALDLTPEGRRASYTLFATTGLGVVLSMLILRYRQNRMLALNVLLILYSGAFTLACLYFGGTSSPTYPLLMLAPTMAGIAGSVTASVAWSGVVAAIWLTLLLLERSGTEFHQIIAEQNYNIAITLGYMATAAAVVSIILVYAETNKQLRHTLQEANRELEFLSTHDPLTGLHNRRHFDQRLGQALERAAQRGSEIGLVTFDLNGFKSINDGYGHGVGDRLLLIVAGRLRREMRETDLVARIGGDEFAILLEDLHSQDEAESVVQKIASALQEPVRVRRHQLQFSASFGIAIYPRHAASQPLLQEQADLAMYRAKRAGRTLAIAD